MAPTADQQGMVTEGDGHHKDVDEKYFSPTLLKEFENVDWSASYEKYGFTPQTLKVIHMSIAIKYNIYDNLHIFIGSPAVVG